MAGGPISIDTPCQSCGYNLRGLSPSGACPECGVPVHKTTDALLQFRDPTWLRRLRTGARLLCCASVFFALWSLPEGLLFWDLDVSGSVRDTFCLTGLWEFSWYYIPTIIFLVGVWYLCGPDLWSGRPAHGDALRTCCRVGLPVVLSALFIFPGIKPGYASMWNARLSNGIELVGHAIVAVYLVCLPLYMKRLGDRLPSRLVRCVSLACLAALAFSWITNSAYVVLKQVFWIEGRHAWAGNQSMQVQLFLQSSDELISMATFAFVLLFLALLVAVQGQFSQARARAQQNTVFSSQA